MNFLVSKTAANFRVASLMLCIAVSIVLPTAASAAQAKSATVPQADPEAMAFVRDLLDQRPTKELSIEGVFQVRHPDGHRSSVPVRYSIRLADSDWQSVYATERTSSMGPEELVVTHRLELPNQYRLTQINLDGSRTNVLSLTGAEAALSLAGSDFWLSDLGLEFLHYPVQRIVRDAKITMRWGRPMKVIESINPRPAVGGYSRVVSWIDSELGSVVRAEAYDTQGKRFKIFELKSFKKVNGRWQVKDMEIRNDQADSRTRLEFHFESE